MKMSAIKKICQNAGRFVVWNSGTQWIGTEEMCFRVEGVRIDSAAIPAIFDLNEKKMEKLVVEETLLEDGELYPLLNWEEGTQMIDWGMVISFGVHDYIILEAEKKMYALDVEAVRGAVGSGEYRQYYLSENSRHEALILICDGMIVTGIAKPMGGRGMEELQKKLRELGMMEAGVSKMQEEEGAYEEMGIQDSCFLYDCERPR